MEWLNWCACLANAKQESVSLQNLLPFRDHGTRYDVHHRKPLLTGSIQRDKPLSPAARITLFILLSFLASLAVLSSPVAWSDCNFAPLDLTSEVVAPQRAPLVSTHLRSQPVRESRSQENSDDTQEPVVVFIQLLQVHGIDNPQRPYRCRQANLPSLLANSPLQPRAPPTA